ncbi:MAG: hypothetical protein JW726_17895 [Anaerolineales bacterium]|nr:hypothetical protein [Anaerolineales bacterium]
MSKRLVLEMDYHKVDYGWMPGWLVIDGQRHPLGASGVFPPFGDLFDFVRAITSGTNVAFTRFGDGRCGVRGSRCL